MGLNTIMGHLDDSDSDLCFRSLSNLKNQKVTPSELARECHKRKWRCMRIHDRIYIAKTESAFDEFRSRHEEGSYTELLSATTMAVPPNENTKSSPPRLPLAQKAHSELPPPSPNLIGKDQLETLSQRAREAVTCCHCFSNERAQQWGHVLRRPADRPDDVAFAPWIGRRYLLTAPRVAVVMLNPGHASAPHKLRRRDLGRRFRDGAIDYSEYIERLTSFVAEWGFGRVVRWLRALRLEPERIAFLNVALCAVADDEYFPALFDTCFERHTRGLLACLKPDVVLLCGKDELAPYQTRIASLGPNVILTWHYRPMDTRPGKRELERVRTELDRLGC